ncbi:MAG: NAD(P)-dependent glycerol-1-phosphate dehydrogenase [Candidatus Hadarchaeota archaeon]|nr:NAD(P)-dependent glycerol-1-phosphate dehydrogenase [Candidatus Hadarchaeota archaeon]
MKEPKRMELPREVWMGPRVLEKIVDVCHRLSLGMRPLIIADTQTFKIAGKKIKNSLEGECFDVHHMIIDQSDMKTVNKVLGLAKDKVDFLLGVGGGTCIDVAKFASFREKIPFLSIPTAASHDGIASSRASIKGGQKPTSVEAQAPVAIIADTLIIKRAPHQLLAAGCGDMVANYTAVHDWELAHRLKKGPYSEYAAALSRMSAKLVMKNAEVIKQHTEESVRKVVKALISSGVAMSIAGNSRPASGSEHLFSHALDLIAPNPALHGEQCGVGAIMMARLQEGNWEAIRDALRTIGCPIDSNGLGIKPEYTIKALIKAREIRPERYTILGEGLDKHAAERLARETGVI